MPAARIVLSIVIVAFLAEGLNAQESASFDGYRGIKDIPYAEVDGHRLLLDLYLPEKAMRPPLVVWVHGGVWRQGSKSQMPLIELVKSGFAISVERLRRQNGTNDLLFQPIVTAELDAP